jgi:serine/threonine-protein kinase
MGKVVEGWDLILRRLVAIKLLHSPDPIHLTRFFREAQHQARLEHPNICRILELGTDPARPYLVMPLIRGHNLADMRDALEPEAIAHLMADVASAVHAAHRAGLVHRDLKPQNIIVERLDDGSCRPIVVDFGLARDLSSADPTLTWAMVGTPAFMSPEQARCADPTPLMDIYSLGATLFALISGHPPFEATTIAGLLTQQAHSTPPPLRRFEASVPRDLETITLKCLENDPDRRYASAFALEADLRRFLAGEPILARRTGWIVRLRQRIRRHRAVSGVLAVGLLTILGLLGWNVQTRLLARRQVALAQRFGMEIREIETLLRVERMLPAHDLRPAIAHVRGHLERLRADMAPLGSSAVGPGHFALGRGLLALGELPAAQASLEKAWNSGYRTNEVAAALDEVHELQFADADRLLWGLPEAQAGPLKEKARREHRDPALAYFRAAQYGAAPDAFNRARLARLQDQTDACIAACREAILAEPWRYEALILEAWAWEEKANEAFSRNLDPKAMEPLFAAGNRALDQAATIARSDIRVHRARISLNTFRASMVSERGRTSLEPFLRMKPVFEEACLIQRDDLSLWHSRFKNLSREGIVRLSRGEDAREHYRQGLAMIAQAEHATGAPHAGFVDPWAIFTWFLADAQWRRGEDPQATLDAVLKVTDPLGVEAADMLIIRARHEVDLGRDPSPTLRQAIQAANHVAGRYFAYYPFTVAGEALLNLAEWEAGAGREARATIAQGLERLTRATTLKPASAYPHWHLARLQSLQARQCLAHGLDPRPAVAAALASGRKAVELRPDHFRSHLGLADAFFAAAQADFHRGGDGVRNLDQARAALRTARSLNPTDWRVALGEARVERFAARHAATPGPLLQRAREAVLRGLAVKPDARDLKALLAPAS